MLRSCYMIIMKRNYENGLHYNQYDARNYQKWFTNCVGNPWKHNQLTWKFYNTVHTIYIELFCSGINSHANQVQKVNELKCNIMKLNLIPWRRHKMRCAEKWFRSMYLSRRAVHSKIHKSHEFAIEDGDTVVILRQLLKLGKDIWYLMGQPVLKFQYIILPVLH